MARKKSKQPGVAHKDAVSGQKKPVSPGDAAAAGGGVGGGEAALERPARTNQSMHTCCLLCHREFKDWGAGLANGLPSPGSKLAEAVPALSQALLREVPGRKLADAVPSLSQSLLGEVPLWICQSCRKSVEEEERRTAQEQSTPASLSHSSSCKSQTCGNGYSEQSSVDWDPSSFLSARKLSGLWNSAHTNTGAHCTHNTGTHSQQAGGTAGPPCHEKRASHEASGTKVCPYSHPASLNPGATSAATPLSTSADLCKTTPKHFKTMCRRPTPPGEAFHPGEHHQTADLSVPPNSPTGLSSQSSSLLPPTKPTSSQHVHANSGGGATHAPFSPLAPGLHVPPGGPDSPAALRKAGACKNAHIPPAGTAHGKLGGSLMGCSHPCNGHGGGGGGATVPSDTAHLTPSACRDQTCKGHKLANGSSCQQVPCELEEGEDEDSSSERSSCASSSTNQRDGKYCDCCYCEFFGHNAPPAAPTSRNYAEIREKLRSRLTRRKEELPQRQDLDPAATGTIDHRDVDELLDFINSTEPKPVNSAKAAKRARHKQKKKEKERALQGVLETACGDQRSSSSPPELAEDESAVASLASGSAAVDGEAGRLLEWPQLELERVNSFLTSRLEEIKNTIKDSIRASFSMYDLNLDVNDFPKKAATLEGNHLLSRLNGSSDMQPIDLDLAPLSLRNFKRDLDVIRDLNGWEDTSPSSAASTVANNNSSNSSSSSVSNNAVASNPSVAKDVQRLYTSPNVSKLILVRSPEQGLTACSEAVQPGLSPAPKPKDECPDAKNAKTKKAKKRQQQQQQDHVAQADQLVTYKSAKAPEKNNEGRPAEVDKGPKVGPKVSQQNQQQAEAQRTGNKKVEESKTPKHASNGAAHGSHHLGSATHGRGKSDADVRGRWSEHEAEGKSNSGVPVNSNLNSHQQQQQQQMKGKNKKNKSKTDKSSSAIDDVFLPKDLDPTEMDEIDREVEYFKRFCLDSAKQTRQKVAVNWSNFSLKKMPSNAAQ